MKMKPRKQVAEFITAQLDGVPSERTDKKMAWHYGKLELRDLMDFLYDGPPKNAQEEVPCEKATT